MDNVQCATDNVQHATDNMQRTTVQHDGTLYGTSQNLCSFLCPCIATPMQYNVVDHQPDKLGTRALTLVTKVIQASPQPR